MKTSIDRRFLFASVVLVVLTCLAYWPVFRADFINYDDREYVAQNEHVKAGLTWAGIKWAFSTDLMGSWHPLTWVSHMADVQFWGLNPASHHATNLVLHLANVLLVLVLGFRWSGKLWPGIVAAGLFALHPLHVESVAWVAERKDVLSAFFGLLSLLAYTRYSQATILHSPFSILASFRSPAYWLAFIFLALGLMSKPMLVTWPFVMLLLDWWPLQRVSRLSSTFHLPSSKWLWLEKLPFFILVGAIALITLRTQHGSAAVMSLQEFPLSARLANTLHSLFIYLFQFVWPTDLVPFYPFNYTLGAGRLLLAGLVVAGLSVMAFLTRRSWPELSFGWCWYLIALLPVCGLVQAGWQAHADRYTYLPSIGIGLALGWSLGRVLERAAGKSQFPVVVLVSVALLLAWRTNEQAQLWQNSEKLWRHTLAVTKHNFMAHQGLAEALLEQGQLVAAKEQFETALQIYPRLPSARNNLGVLLTGEGKYEEALTEFAQVLAAQPDFHMVHFNRAEAYERSARYLSAFTEYCTFVAHQPQDQEAWVRVARCLAQLRQPQELQAAAAVIMGVPPVDPRLVAALAVQWQAIGKPAEAVACYAAGLAVLPDSAELHNNFAWLLATFPDVSIRDGGRAVVSAEKACQLTGSRQPFFLGTLAAAYAEAGRFSEAITTAEKAIALATAAGQPQIAARNAELLERYRAGKPYHEPAQ